MQRDFTGPIRLLVLLVACVASRTAYAGSDVRLSVLAGIGTANVSAENVNKTEEPFAFSVSFDYSWSHKFTVGLEHSRSVTSSPLNSRVGLTGAVARLYPVYAIPHVMKDAPLAIETTLLREEALAPWLGAGLGFGQSSLFRREQTDIDTSTTGAYASLHFGADYPLSSRLGLRGEASYAMTIAGSGELNFFSLKFGIVTFL